VTEQSAAPAAFAKIDRPLDRALEACRERALVLTDFLAASRAHFELGSGGRAPRLALARAEMLAGCAA
jgi:hypothetical protein